ncbi:ANP1/MMN9/VAN1 family protein [Patescibacteria group bacterium]|nr:ANP1/MMN9/VAN1 family protein [Patescibacteria group bacterium]
MSKELTWRTVMVDGRDEEGELRAEIDRDGISDKYYATIFVRAGELKEYPGTLPSEEAARAWCETQLSKE